MTHRLRLAGTARSAVYLAGGVAAVIIGEEHIDASQFGWLPWPAQGRRSAEFFQLLHRCPARYL